MSTKHNGQSQKSAEVTLIQPWNSSGKPRNYAILFVCLLGDVFNAAFNNSSVISWQSALLMEKTTGPGENHGPVASHWQTLSHNVVHLPWSRFELTTSVVIGTDCIGSCKSNYYTITATTAPQLYNNSYPRFQYFI